MNLDEYNEAVKNIFAKQQTIAQDTAKLALAGTANPTDPQFGKLIADQWSLIQEMAKLNTDAMTGVMANVMKPKG